MKNAYTIYDFERDFPDDAACLEFLKNLRWPRGITCKNCKRITKHHRVKARLCYACDVCGNHVYPQAGTVLQDSRTKLRSWFHAIFLMSTTRMGIAAKQLERELGVTYKTAWRMFRMIRQMMLDNEGLMALLGKIEVDESYFGGKIILPSQRRARPASDPAENASARHPATWREDHHGCYVRSDRSRDYSARPQARAAAQHGLHR